MSHTFTRVHIHLIFSTRGRRKSIHGEAQENLWAYIRAICRSYEVDVLAIGGVEDHVHICIALPPKHSLSTIVRAIKANSSKWMNENGHLFSWQDGYAAFSVSTSALSTVIDYIENQTVHHHKMGFEEEVRAFLEKNGGTYNPEFLFG